MKLRKRRPGRARRARAATVTTCPECGSEDIEWTVTSLTLRHGYVCRACGYQGEVVVETRTPTGS